MNYVLVIVALLALLGLIAICEHLVCKGRRRCGGYGPRELLDWAVEKGWSVGATPFDVYEGTPFTREEFDEITAKAESLGKVDGLKYLEAKINTRFHGFGRYA